jgi:methyl-accepting chemotaxis protein
MTESLNISAELVNIVDSLGEIFLNIADRYPRMLGDLETKTSELKKSDQRDDVCHNLEDLVKEIQEVVDKQGLLLTQMLEKDSLFLDNMASELETLKSLDSEIDSIEDDSAELELISLNAMVTALKAGKNGGAFPYITEELQKVSKESALQSKRLKTKGGELNQYFMQIVDSMNTDKSSMTDSINSIEKSFKQLLEVSSQYQRMSSSVLSSINSNSRSLKEPVHQIISEVQKHDIVRQSVDHIILSLDHVEADTPESNEEKLESLSYESRVYGFCFDILEDIRTELMGTFQLFRSKAEELKEVVDYLKDTGRRLSESGGENSSRLRIMEIQNELYIELEGINRTLRRELFQKELEDIFKEIDLLDKTYSSFSRIIHWIKTINISSRVEAAKLPHLDNMTFIIENIRERTDSIENSVEEISRSIQHFKKGSGRIFSTFMKHGSRAGENVEKYNSVLQSKLGDVESCSIDLERNMAELLEAGEQFKVVYNASREDLVRMETLIGQIDRILTEFEGRKNITERRLQQALSDSGLQHWEIKGEKIRELIDKFTIYVHKKKADIDDTLDVIDEGAESGEITLF